MFWYFYVKKWLITRQFTKETLSDYCNWFKLYFICIIYDKFTNNAEYDYNTTTIQMGFRRKSNDLFESVSQEFTLHMYYHAVIVIHVENNGRTL